MTTALAKVPTDRNAGATKIWQNWSRSVTSTPGVQARPTTEDALRQCLLSAEGGIRVTGAGHSFTPLCQTDQTLISLDQMPGDVFAVDAETNMARLQAGASLNQLSRALQDRGFGFKNLGDIDVQSLAGATATATHGTGKTFPCLSGEIRAVRLMTAEGQIVEADVTSDRDLLRAARVSLGALGILMEATVAVRPAFKLHRVASVVKLRDLLSSAEARWDQNRNFEFFVLPHCDFAFAITHNETDAPDRSENKGDDEASLRQLRWVRNSLQRMPRLRRLVMNAALRGSRAEDRVGTSWQLLASVRNTRFNEMEYHLPVDQGLEALQEALALIERDRPEVFFPIEVRMTAGDDSWLSPFQGGPRISVAVHSYGDEDFGWMLSQLEPIFLRRGGRPHWGKLHSLKAADLRPLYPDFERFCDLRHRLDPRGRFLTPYLADLFCAHAVA